MDINSLYGVSPSYLNQIAGNSNITKLSTDSKDDIFSSFLNSAIHNISETNSYLSDAENEEIKFAMGETENTHDLTIALQKASASLQYTIAVRDKLIEAYNEIMRIQI